MRYFQFTTTVLCSLAILAMAPGSTAAQEQQDRTITIITGPTVVQLPTFHTFSVNTTVLVPDRGGAYLGGSGGYSSRRSLAGGALGGGTAAGGLWVGTQVHDLQMLDENLLGSDPAAVTPSRPASDRRFAGLTAPSEGVAAIRAQLAAEDAQKQDEALGYLARGRDALARGRPGAAKVYLQMAATRSTGDTREQALAELRAISAAERTVATAK